MKKVTIAFFVLILSSLAYGQRPLVQYDYENLNKLKSSIEFQTASKETMKVYTDLLRKADKILDKENPTVVNKTIETPTKDKNDYLSISRYWWPDESKEKGLPWVRKDGETNPDTQTDAVDRKRLSRMSNYVSTLSLAYFLSEDEKYAKKCVSVVKTWFINPRTRMNPHLRYAQSVPGIDKSRRAGILDGREIPLKVLDGVTLISSSDYWKDKDNEEFSKWLNDYMNWLSYSDIGLQGAEQPNNHGSWYYYQLAALAYYNKDIKIINRVVKKTKEMFKEQLDENGGQTHELKRTRSFFYSCFNLDAITRIAIIAEKAGMPIWDYKSEDGEKGIEKALDFVLPVVYNGEWKYKTKKKDDKTCLAPVLMRVTKRLDNDKYKEALELLINESIVVEDKTKRQKKIYKDYHFLNLGLF